MLNLTSMNAKATKAQIIETVVINGVTKTETRHLRKAMGGYRDKAGRTYQINGGEVHYGGTSIAE